MTTEKRITVDEIRAFLDANPSVQWIDVFLFDLNGIPRGKRIRRVDLPGVAKSGVMMPSTVFIMDPLGNCIEETGRLWETGDPDIHCHLLAGTLATVPVGDGRHAQAVMAVDGGDELCPRAVLAKQVARLARAGQKPVAAVELEFYVTKRGANGFALEVPDGLSDDPDRPMTFGFEEMDALGPFIDDIYKVCEAQGLPVDAVMQETGPGQFEINLKHRDDAVRAALDGLLLKRAVKAAARAHGLDATFMAKPHHDWAGSGLHVHLSLYDGKGREPLRRRSHLSPLPPCARRPARDHGRLHGHLGPVRQRLPALCAQVLRVDGRPLGVQQSHGGAAHTPCQRFGDPRRASRCGGGRQSLSRACRDPRRREPRDRQ